MSRGPEDPAAGARASSRDQWRDQGLTDRDFQDEWNGLVERDPEGSPFQTAPWVMTWHRHFGAGRRLVVLTVRRAQRLVALAPLVEGPARVAGLRVRALGFAGDPQADLLGAPCEAGAAGSLVDALLERLSHFDVMRLTDVAVGSQFERALQDAARLRGLRIACRVCARAPVLRLNRPLAEIEASYSKSLRTRLSRARRRQLDAGGVVFRRWQPRVDDLDGLLPRLRAVEQSSWKGGEGVGVFSPEPRFRFIAELSRELAGSGWLDVATLSLDDRLIAYRYGFRFRGVFYDYNLAHDPEWDQLSPGRVLLDDVVRDSHRLGLSSVDASRGEVDRPHLLADWSDVSRWHRRWLLFGPSLRGRGLSLLERRLKPGWRWVCRSEARLPAAAAALNTPASWRGDGGVET